MTHKPKLSFYRRSLPSPPAIAFASKVGRVVFREALLDGGMESYFPLAEQFRTQNDPAYCGLGTLVMVLNALAIDPGKLWKGGWRWYSEEMLDCCKTLKQIKKDGISIKEFYCLALCNGAQGKEKNPIDFTIAEFRKDVMNVCSDPLNKQVLVLNYSRKELKQTGDGHYSPIGGYNRERDLVLIMDVARFKYPPHWAPLELVYQSMKRLDPDTKKCRGWMLFSASPDAKPLVFCWKGNAALGHFIHHIPRPSNLSDKAYTKMVLEYMVSAQVCKVRGHDHDIDLERDPLSQKHEVIRENCLKDVRSLPLYSIALAICKERGLPTSKAAAAALCALISVPFLYPDMEELFRVDPEMMPDLDREIRGLRRQLEHSCMGSKCNSVPEENLEIKI